MKHWVNYCLYIVPDMLEQYRLEPGPLPPFRLEDPLQSLRLDKDALQRALLSFSDMVDKDGLDDGIGPRFAQAALSALSTAGFDIRDAPCRWPKNYLVWALRTIDLRDADLRTADLSEADLSGIHLEQVDLRSADLTDSNLTNAVISLCDLRGADLTGAALCYASISECNCENAVLAQADLTACALEYCQMAHSDCTEICLAAATLQHDDFFETQLAHADLSGTAIEMCTFEKTAMQAIELTRASITGSAMHGALMTRALLRYTIVQNCDLRGADFDSADLTGIQFLNSRTEGATFRILPSDCKTIVYSYRNQAGDQVSLVERSDDDDGYDCDFVEQEDMDYKTIDRASFDYNLSGLRLQQQPNGISLDDDRRISKYHLPIEIDRRLRMQLNEEFASCDSDPEGSYLDPVSDSASDSESDTEDVPAASGTQAATSAAVPVPVPVPVPTAPTPSWTALACHILWLLDLPSIRDFFTMRHYAHAATRYVHAQRAARHAIPRLTSKAAHNKPVVPRAQAGCFSSARIARPSRWNAAPPP